MDDDTYIEFENLRDTFDALKEDYRIDFKDEQERKSLTIELLKIAVEINKNVILRESFTGSEYSNTIAGLLRIISLKS